MRFQKRSKGGPQPQHIYSKSLKEGIAKYWECIKEFKYSVFIDFYNGCASSVRDQNARV